MSSLNEASYSKVNFDPEYEIKRVTDESKLMRKLRIKRSLHRWVGEVYIGKRVKLKYFQDWLKRLPLPESPSLLEVGSGDGVFSFAAAKWRPDAKVLGMELNQVEAKGCQHIAEVEGFKNLHFESGLLSDHRWESRYDLAFCLDVLEHIHDDVGTLKDMLSALKPGAAVLVHVPNRYYLDIDNKLSTVPDKDAWRVNPGHVRHGYTPAELQSALQSAGFEVREIQQTQGRPIAYAHRLYKLVERLYIARIALLPIIDWLIHRDRRRTWSHGNTLWAHAVRPKFATPA